MLILEIDRASAAYNFVFSQRAVYSHPDTRPGSLFDDGNFYQLNLKLAVNIVTFFKFYFTVRGGSAMYSHFQKLKPHQVCHLQVVYTQIHSWSEERNH